MPFYGHPPPTRESDPLPREYGHPPPIPKGVWDPAVDPVLNSPYEPPGRHWKLDERGQAIRGEEPLTGRRAPLAINVPRDAKAPQPAQTSLHLGDRTANKAVMDVRAEVARWRDADYRGATAVTQRLLHHWTDPDAMRQRPFFAQVEAVETFIWLREVANRATPARRALEDESRRHNDGIVRWCAKMATGTGKTAVMGMVIAWQTLNAARDVRSGTRNIRYTDRFVLFAPGHTVRQRLAVLTPSGDGNVYDEMGIVPQDLRDRLNRAKVRVVNFQTFTQRELIDDSKARNLLGKTKGADIESWKAAVRRVLGDLIDSPRGLCVINDEAHHCYLPPPRRKRTDREQKDEDHRASVWFNTIRALRDMKTLGPVTAEHGQAHPVLDFSATPLWIDTASKSEPEQFQWVTSDFGLMDAIESGLVKVPRVPIDDDSTRDETIWRKLYDNTKAKKLKEWFASSRPPHRLPEHLDSAVDAVVADYGRTLRAWSDPGDGKEPQPTPPVIIFVVNNIANATALYRYIAGHRDEAGEVQPGRFGDLSNVDDDGNWHETPRTLIVHSKVAGDDTIPNDLKKLLIATAGAGTQKDAEASVREMLNTVGRVGRPGEQVRCVVSVSMLTEGWDARTVTHVVGFRAFSTQLLCEQVTGRALRRTSYDALREPDPDGRRRLEAEYADVVGIPFEFMPDVDTPPESPSPPKPRTRVHTVAGRRTLRVSWPNVIEYQRIAPQGRFMLDPGKVRRWAPQDTTTASMAALRGSAGVETIIASIPECERQRKGVWILANDVTNMLTLGPGSDACDSDRSRAGALGRIRLFSCAFIAVQDWLAHPEIAIEDPSQDILTDKAHRVSAAEAILDACDYFTTEPTRRARLGQPSITDTAAVDFETTLAHIGTARRSELSHAACHSRLELRTAEQLDNDARVLHWVRNFQLGWTLPYHVNGVWRRYEPDFVAVLENGLNLIIECKGTWDAKALAAAEWTKQHWIPCVAGTPELPDGLRRWHYGVIDDNTSVQHQLATAIADARRTPRDDRAP